MTLREVIEKELKPMLDEDIEGFVIIFKNNGIKQNIAVGAICTIMNQLLQDATDAVLEAHEEEHEREENETTIH